MVKGKMDILAIVAHLAVGNGFRFAGLFAESHDRVWVRLAQQVIFDQLFRPVKPSLADLKDVPKAGHHLTFF
jgi:hypothetical protein